MILEQWECDRCGERSEADLLEAPEGWVEVTRYESKEEDDMGLHFCGWECAMHGCARALEVRERIEEASADEAG